jgi:hypothetical protein
MQKGVNLMIDDLIEELVENYGYDPEFISKNVSLSPNTKKRKKFLLTDAVVWDSKEKQQPLIIIEIKDSEISPSREQLLEYMKYSGAKFGIWYNGKTRITLGVQEGIIVEIPDIPSKIAKSIPKNPPIVNPEEKFFRIFDLLRNYLRSRNQVDFLIEILHYKLIDEQYFSDKHFLGADIKNCRNKLKQISDESKKIHEDISFYHNDHRIIPEEILFEIILELRSFSLKNSNGEAIRQIILDRMHSTDTFDSYKIQKEITNLLFNFVNIQQNEKVFVPFSRRGDEIFHLIDYFCDKFELFDKKLKSYSQENIFGSEINDVSYSIQKFFLLLRNYTINTKLTGFFNFDKSISSSNVVFAIPPFGYTMNNYNERNDQNIEKFGSDFDSYFLSTLVDNLPDGGKAVVLLTNSFFIRHSKINQETKNKIIQNCTIKAIIGLPAGLFHPMTSISTCALVIEKIKPKKDYDIFMSDIDIRLKHNEKLNFNVIKEIQEKFESVTKHKTIKENSLGFLTNIQKIMDDGWTIRDKSPLYANLEIKNPVYLKDIANIIVGRNFVQSEKGIEIPQVRSSDLSIGDLDKISRTIKISPKKLDSKNFPWIKKGDILLSVRGVIGSRAFVSIDEKATVHPNLVILRLDPKKIDSDYFLNFLGQDIFKFQLHGKLQGGFPYLPLEKLKKIKIPLPSLNEQREQVHNLKKIQKEILELKNKLRELENLRNEFYHRSLN